MIKYLLRGRIKLAASTREELAVPSSFGKELVGRNLRINNLTGSLPKPREPRAFV